MIGGNLLHILIHESEQRIDSLKHTLAYCQLYSAFNVYIPFVRSAIRVENYLLRKLKRSC